MEGEARDQKLKAGKEKLAQFQRKKRKKKPRPEEAGSSTVTVGESANILPPLPAEFETDLTIDSDSLTTTSGSEDDADSAQGWSSRAQLQLKSKLQEKSRRVEELEESLVGKQLALDKVIQENEKLKTLISHVQHTEVSDANHNALDRNKESQNQSSPVNGMTDNQTAEAGTSANTEVNEAGSQEFSMSDVQELLHHVHWLQLQLKQANTTLQTQNEKQKESMGALQNAKKEIAILQDSITHKDKLLNELIDKMKQISIEYESFKQHYAKNGENKNDNMIEELEKHCHTVEEMNTALKKELQKVVTEKEKEIQELIDTQGVKIGQLTEEYEMKIKELESELKEIRIKHEEQKLNNDKIQNENVGLQSYCDTLTKGLEFLKEEHEKAVTELNELSAGFTVLKSEYDILVDEKGQFVAKSESLEAELYHSQTEKEHISTEMSVLKRQYEYLEKELNDTKEQLEIVRVEHQRYFNDNNTLVDQLAKQKEDNIMYQNQIAEYEGKLCESAEILEENRSLHWQNDELNNRINNQKDVIASLKNELEVLGMEKSQFVDHMKSISADLEEIKKENDILKSDKEQLLNEVIVLKENMHHVGEENMKYKVSHVALNEEIQSLKQSLSEARSEMQVKVPLLTSGRYTKFELTATDMNDMNREKLDKMKSSEEVEDVITVQENVFYTEEMPLVGKNQTHKVSLNSDQCETEEIENDSAELCENLSESVPDKTEMTGSAKTKNVSPTIFQDKNRKIEELEGEIEKLNNVLVQLQASALSAGVSASVHKGVQKDEPDENEVDSISNKVSTQTSTDDTAYESLYFEHQGELGGTGISVLEERLAETQQKLATVSEMLRDRNKEYEEVKLALMQAQEQFAQGGVALETTNEDSTNKSALQLKHYTQPKVSENCSVTSLGMEVNMHASSSFCFVPNDGVVSLDSSPAKNVKGDSEFYVDKGSFQNLADPVDEKQFFSDTKLNDIQVPDQELHVGVGKLAESSFTDQAGSTENSGIQKSETFESMKLLTSVGTVTMLDEKSLICELELTKESVRKTEIERRKLESINIDLQMKLKEFNDTEHERKEKAEELCHEHDKITWERDQLIESLHNIEKEMFAIKTAKCDVEFQKVQYEEELNRVKERLEYLESSDNDIIEIRDMLEKVQEERENIVGENEKLQCSLSAHIEENEKLLESVDYLQKENSSYLERLEEMELEIINVTTEYKDCKSKIEKLEKSLSEITSEKISQESRFDGEIEGLLEENSTLKTSVQMKESEIETLVHENKRLNSFFPNIDEQNENSKLLKARNGDLEKEMKEMALENQSLVSQLLETQEKLSGAAAENEELLDKCDEFQRVICELDDEKATLVESYERAKQETKAQLKENENLIEKYEKQLECLDQENSTLKTQLMSLHQEIEDGNMSYYDQEKREKDHLKSEKEMLQIENERYKVKVQELEEDLLGLVEQVKSYEETVKENEDISVRLEANIKEILQENTQLKEKCASIEESLHEQKENEIYLKEQMKIYESALNSEEETKGHEVQRLESQLELEKKYKSKFENSLAQAQTQISEIESENTSLKDMNGMLQRDLKLEVQKTSELEQEFSHAKSELENVLIERESKVIEKMEQGKKLIAITKANEELKSEVSLLQNHLQAVADNRNHIRNQIEILAAEIENLQMANESLELQNRELCDKFKLVVSSNDKLTEEHKLFMAEIEEISDKSKKLAEENELLRQRDKMLEDSIQENLGSIKEEMNSLHFENEKLTEENVRLKGNMENNSSKTTELQSENDRLKSENKDLEDQNEKLKTRFQSLGEKLASLDELIERNIAAELDNDSLGDRLDVLHKRIGEIQKEKESLQVMTNELTNMLHDMQTKYEEVKSEMESTKKKCDKEIEHLQNQLHEMNDDVSELRKMLDYMENEMYSTTEEKNMLKENLEQQQSQFAEVIEEKQKLEEIISNKQQKDLKNMQMASQRQRNIAVPYSRSEQDIPCNEPNTVEAFCSSSEFNEAAAPAVSERMRESIDSDLSDIVPSFQSAFHLVGHASSGETRVSSRMVQTNITMSGRENTDFMIYDSGENTDCNTDSSKIHSEAQTDISYQPYSNFNFQNSVFEPLFNESDENEITNVPVLDFAYNTPGFGNGELTAQGVADSHQTGRISEVKQNVEDSYCKSLGKCNNSSQTEIQVKSVYCQNDTTLSPNFENSELLTQDNISLQTDLEENMVDSNSGNVSILSADSGVLSACVCVDGKIQPFHYSDNETVIDKEIHNEQDAFEAEKFVGISSENSNNISKEAEFFNVGIQTDIDFCDEIENSLADDRERFETDYEEKIKELEAEIESRLMKAYEFREQKIKLLEDNYERKVKQVEYDLEEKYEQKFRMREVEIIMEADRDKKTHAAEVENATEIKVEQIKREKDQQFVETLQKVKAELAEKHRRDSGDMRRVVSHDVRLRDRAQDIGPDGDGTGTHGVNTWQKLAAENQKLAEGDDSQKSVDTNRQNTIAFCHQLLGIMGEHTTMGNDKAPKNQQAPTLLDWDLSPELSFGSVQSSLDTNILERSLDTSTVCSNSECLNLRMKYQQLMGKIEQYLKLTTSQGHVKESDIKCAPDVVDGKNEFDKDKFVEHDEDLSHMLYRGTSIDLEHCFRVPSSLNENSLDDHFVEEVDDTRDTVEITCDIIDLLVKDSNDAAVKKYNCEGHFSENEEVDEENEGDEQKQMILDHGRCSISVVEDTGAFFSEESLQFRKKRHFSESDLGTKLKKSESETSQSENKEGFFVLEGGVSKEEADQRSKSKNYDISDVEVSDEDGNSDGIFEEIQNSLDAPVIIENTESPRLHLEPNKFIEESNEYKPPGLEEFAMCAKTEPLTGEEAGDFFEEKIVKSVVLSSGSLKSTDTVALSTSLKRDLADVAQNLESDLSSVKQEYKKGNQSYENTVFDILNAICPGTVPGRRPCDSVAKEDTFQPVIGEVESAVNDFGESQTMSENNLQRLKAALGNMKLELQSLTKENTDLKEMMIIKDLGSKKDIEVLEEKITVLEMTNLEKNVEVLHAEQLLSSNRNLEKANMELLNDLEIYKNQVSCFESDLEGKAKENADKLEMLKMVLESETNEQKNLKLQYTETEKLKNELELQCCRFLVQNEKLESDLKLLENSLKNNEKEMNVLKEEKGKLISENNSLKSVIESNEDVVQSQEKLKLQIQELLRQENVLREELKEQTGVFQVEKDELEKALIAQADMYDSLEKTVKDQEIENNKLQERLGIQEKNEVALRENIEIVMNENKILEQDLEREISTKMELKITENELLSKISALKCEINELNVMSSQMSTENEKLKVTAKEAVEKATVMKEENEKLNSVIQDIGKEKIDMEEELHDKETTILELVKIKQDLVHQIEIFEEDAKSLQSNVAEMKETVDKLTKENNKLESFQSDLQGIQEENESLKFELLQMKERTSEKLAIQGLSKEVEKQELYTYSTNEVCQVDKSTEIKDIIDGLEPKENKRGLVDAFSNTGDHLGFEIHEKELAVLKEEIICLKTKNTALENNLKEIPVRDTFEQELEALKLENETLKRSLDFAIVKDDSDTDLQIFEDMKDAIRSMQAEKSSVDQYEKEMSDNMEQENKKLRDEIEDLYAETDQLKKSLKNQEESARKENREILKMYSDLRNEVEVLVISKHDLEVELHALKDLLEHDPYPTLVKSEHDTSKELTLEDLEEMEELKASIEKLKSDLKERDSYVRKLEEHLLSMDSNIPELTSTPKPSLSKGMPFISKSFLRRGQNLSSHFGRRAYSQDIPSINVEKEFDERNSVKPEFERSQTLDLSLHMCDLESCKPTEKQFHDGLKSEKLTSSVLSDSSNTSVQGSVDVSERIRSGLKAEEDGHLALELKQFELVAEITKLRRDFRETKALYSKETALLTEALEKEKLANELRGMSDLSLEHNVGSNLSHDVLKLRKEVATLREQNKLLNIDCDRWVERLKEQEQIVADLKERISQNTSGYEEIEEVFGRQLALLQKQREELIDKLKDRERENSSLSANLGEKGILEETLRKEKDVLSAKLKEKEKIEEELLEKKLLLEEQANKQKELEDIVYQKDLNEIELMKQKRILEEELREIESRFRDREENLNFEKNQLLNELREKRTKAVRSRLSESEDEVSSVCSESSAFSERNIGRLEVMLEEVEKQHSLAVNVLREQLHVKYNRREKELRKEHAAGLARLKQDSRNQVK